MLWSIHMGSSKKALLGALFALATSSPALSLEVGGVTLEDSRELRGKKLLLNGAGIRNKYFVDVYVAGLYLPEQNTSAESIISSKDFQSVRLVITSSRITRERLIEAITDGIRKSSGKDFARYEPMLGELWSAMTFEVKEGDVFDFNHVPDEGVHFVRNGSLLRVMTDFGFKKILFGIWLGDDPVQTTLKADLLSS
jgi:hypothetical protein